MSSSTGRGYVKIVGDIESPEDDNDEVIVNRIEDALEDRYEASMRYYEDFVTGKAGDILVVDNPTRNADPVRSADYADKFALGTTPFITRTYVNKDGMPVRHVAWLAHEKFNWWTRFSAGIVFTIAAIMTLIFALVSGPAFSVKTRLTTDFVTDGLTPTDVNGLLNVVGIGKWVWWIMASFALSAFIHLFGTGIFAHVWITVGNVVEGRPYSEAALMYHNWVSAPGNYGYDPTKLALFCVGWGVIGTVVAQAVGITNIVLLVASFFLICHFGYAFLFAQDWQHSRFAKVFAYAVPHARVRGSVQTAGGSIRESSDVDPQTGRPFLVSAADGLARSPAILAHTLTKAITSLRRSMGVGPAVRPEDRIARDNAFKQSLDTRVRDIELKVDASPEGSYLRSVSSTVLAVPTAEQVSMANLYEDLYYAFNNPWHMVSGWFTFAVIVVIYSCYYFSALHSDSGAFDYWSHVAYWVFMFVLAAFGGGYNGFWWSEKPLLREATVTDIGPWHFMFSTIFQLLVGFILVAGPHGTGLIF